MASVLQSFTYYVLSLCAFYRKTQRYKGERTGIHSFLIKFTNKKIWTALRNSETLRKAFRHWNHGWSQHKTMPIPHIQQTSPAFNSTSHQGPVPSSCLLPTNMESASTQLQLSFQLSRQLSPANFPPMATQPQIKFKSMTNIKSFSNHYQVGLQTKSSASK